MNNTTTFNSQRQADVERREALNWLARRLSWENRLGQLRPSDDRQVQDREVAQTRQAA
jgi:hypothetical protein